MITTINEFKKYLNNAKKINEGRGNTIIRFENQSWPTYYIEYYSSTDIDEETGEEYTNENANDMFVEDLVGNIEHSIKTVELTKLSEPKWLDNDQAVYFENDIMKVIFADNEWSMAVGCIPVFSWQEVDGDEIETYNEDKFNEEVNKFFTGLLEMYTLHKATSAWTSAKVDKIDENNNTLRDKIIALYKSGKSQAEIADELNIDTNIVINNTKHLGIHVGSVEEEERDGDDPMSKQYYDRTIKK
jgi:hypothetical protein